MTVKPYQTTGNSHILASGRGAGRGLCSEELKDGESKSYVSGSWTDGFLQLRIADTDGSNDLKVSVEDSKLTVTNPTGNGQTSVSVPLEVEGRGFPKDIPQDLGRVDLLTQDDGSTLMTLNNRQGFILR